MQCTKLILIVGSLVTGALSYGMGNNPSSAAADLLNKLNGTHHSNPEPKPFDNLCGLVQHFNPEEHNPELMEQAYQDAPSDVKELIYAHQHPEFFDFGIESRPSQVLLVGPPGTGKTTLSLAIAFKLKRMCSLIHTANLRNSYQASAAENFRTIINYILNQKKPWVILADEITALVNEGQENGEGKETAAALWDKMDECARLENILFIATTNYPKRMPQPLKSRFRTNCIEVPVASAEHLTRKFLDLLRRKNHVTIECDDIEQFLQEKLERGISYRDLHHLINKILISAKFENQDDTEIKITRPLLERIFDNFKHISSEVLDYDAPDVSLQERLHEDNKDFQRDLAYYQMMRQAEFQWEMSRYQMNRQERFTTHQTDRQERFAHQQYHQQSCEDTTQNFTASIPWVGSMFGSYARAKLHQSFERARNN